MDDEQQQKVEEDQVKAFYDEERRRQHQDYKTGSRKTPLSNDVLTLLGGLLQPQTTGFSQVNLDMSFSYLDSYDVQRVMNSSFLITFCKLYGFKRSEYMERSVLATLLNAKRSFQGKSMELFTTTVTKQQQEYQDKTEKKTGFLQSLGFQKKE